MRGARLDQLGLPLGGHLLAVAMQPTLGGAHGGHVGLLGLGAALALGELVMLDVQGFPLMRHWHVVYPQGKRLSAATLAFKDWLFAHRPIASATDSA